MSDVTINAYDLDGTIWDGSGSMLTPEWKDVIITGRGYHEMGKTLLLLRELDIDNQVFFFPGTESEKNHASIANHKANILSELRESGITVNYFFENEIHQVSILRRLVKPEETKIIHIGNQYAENA